ncbi:hypothetical protein ACFROC_01800 [Nocardia tengchongensis]|uniref:hypothetical protein n=1 Tax=Nocardia tengchongensis TaxID=2055889 RepID=UPI00367EEA16
MARTPVQDDGSAADQLQRWAPTDPGAVWPPVSKPMAEQVYPAVMIELKDLTDEPGLSTHLAHIIDALGKSPRIAGVPASIDAVSQRYATAGHVLGDVEQTLRTERIVLQHAWRGFAGGALQALLASITADTARARLMSELGARTLAKFSAQLDHAQKLEIDPRSQLSDAAATVAALPSGAGLDNAEVLAAQQAAESGCNGLTAARAAATSALLDARDGLRARRPPSVTDLLSIDASFEIAGDIVHQVDPSLIVPESGASAQLSVNQDRVQASTTALRNAVGALFALTEEPNYRISTFETAAFGELTADLSEFQLAEVASLRYVEKRLGHLTHAMAAAGIDLAVADEASADSIRL